MFETVKRICERFGNPVTEIESEQGWFRFWLGDRGGIWIGTNGDTVTKAENEEIDLSYDEVTYENFHVCDFWVDKVGFLEEKPIASGPLHIVLSRLAQHMSDWNLHRLLDEIALQPQPVTRRKVYVS